VILRWPWLVSAAFHLALAGVVAVLLNQPMSVPPVLRMRLISSESTSQQSVTASPGVSSFPQSAVSSLAQADLPQWRTTEVPAPPTSWSASPPVALEELLGADVSSDVAFEPVWSSSAGQGYAPPSLPVLPPGLAPVQGALWTLVLTVPPGGGPARSFDGLDSGHPELDRWLELYLRTVSFPSSIDGQEYQVRWTLRLESGKPR